MESICIKAPEALFSRKRKQRCYTFFITEITFYIQINKVKLIKKLFKVWSFLDQIWQNVFHKWNECAELQIQSKQF